jgi:xylulokinase
VAATGTADTGLEPGTPVVAGTIDAWAEAVSVGARRAGDLMLMYGSTMFLVLGVEEPAENPSIWTTRGVDPGSLTAAAGMATSGSLTAWLRDLCGQPTFAQLLAEAAAAGPGSHGLLLLPYFAGERTPILDPNARGALIGLTLSHNRGHLYRAALEATAYGVRHNLEALAPARVRRILAVGGGTQDDLWVQIVSDVTGITQEIPRERIGACYGDALFAAEGVGLAPSGSDWAVPERSLVPNGDAGATYDKLYDLYRDFYVTTAPLAHSLARFQRRDTWSQHNGPSARR